MNVQVVENVLRANDAVAEQTRRRLDEAGTIAVNLMSSPGSGKTALLERTLESLPTPRRSAVLVGDLATSRDAERLSRFDVPVIQINTGKGCHLDAAQVSAGLAKLETAKLDWLFIENVGNLVCPTEFDLGEHARVVLLSLPEGDDKVGKYPLMFAKADCILLTKLDLLGVLSFDRELFYSDVSNVNSAAPVLEISSTTGQGIDKWLDWLRWRRQPS